MNMVKADNSIGFDKMIGITSLHIIEITMPTAHNSKRLDAKRCNIKYSHVKYIFFIKNGMIFSL